MPLGGTSTNPDLAKTRQKQKEADQAKEKELARINTEKIKLAAKKAKAAAAQAKLAGEKTASFIPITSANKTMSEELAQTLARLEQSFKEEKARRETLERELAELKKATPQTSARPSSAAGEIQEAIRDAFSGLRMGNTEEIPFSYNAADSYLHTFSALPSEDAKAHMYGFIDFITPFVEVAPQNSKIRGYDWQVAKFKQTLKGDARSWLVNSTFYTLSDLKEAFLERFHKVKTTVDDITTLSRMMNETENVESFAHRLLKAAKRTGMLPEKQADLLISLLTPTLRSYALTQDHSSIDNIVQSCKKFARYNPTTSKTNSTAQNHNSVFSISTDNPSEPSKVDNILEGVCDILAKFESKDSRGRSRKDSPHPTKGYKKPHNNSESHQGNRYHSKDSHGKHVSFSNSGKSSRHSSQSRNSSRQSSRASSAHSSRASSRSSSRHDSRDSKSRHRPKKDYGKEQSCYNCGKPGHFWRNCLKPRQHSLRKEAEFKALMAYHSEGNYYPQDNSHFPNHSK